MKICLRKNVPDGTSSTGEEARGSANVIFIRMTEPMLVPAHRLGFAVDSELQIDGIDGPQIMWEKRLNSANTTRFTNTKYQYSTSTE